QAKPLKCCNHRIHPVLAQFAVVRRWTLNRRLSGELNGELRSPFQPCCDLTQCLRTRGREAFAQRIVIAGDAAGLVLLEVDVQAHREGRRWQVVPPMSGQVAPRQRWLGRGATWAL